LHEQDHKTKVVKLMIKKEYYRISELERRFEITFEDILYLVNEGKLAVWIYKGTTKYIVGGWAKNKGFIAHGLVVYRGLIQLLPKDQRKVLEKGKLKINNFGILNDAQILSFSTVNPFNVEFPSGPIHSWIPTKTTELKWEIIPAKFLPVQTVHPIKSVLSTLIALTKPFDPDNNSSIDTVRKELMEQALSISTNELCVRRIDLLTAGIIKTDEVIPSLTNHMEEVDYKNDFQELLAQILTSKKGLGKKIIYKILIEELEREEDERFFDYKNILSHRKDDGTIIWIDKFSPQPEKQCSFGTLGNHLTATRKLLNSSP
jgi:hypothetical protein